MHDPKTIPDCFYRVSIKALILNETRDKFLITRDVLADKNGTWDLPGGGLDWGETPQSDLPRELQEEMGIEATYIADHPSYFVTHTSAIKPELWLANVIYETKIDSYDFTASVECTEIAWMGPDNIDDYNLFEIIAKFARQFDPKRHQT